MTADGLFCRDVGDGRPIIVVHGRPDFDHTYLLPELDRLAIEHQLHAETSRSADWDLFPAPRELDVPTFLLHGEHDFIPVELAARIVEAVPDARLTVLPGCGHFTYLEAPERVFEEVARFCGA